MKPIRPFPDRHARGFQGRQLNSDRIRRSKGFRDGALDAGCGVNREAILTAIAKGLERSYQAVITFTIKSNVGPGILAQGISTAIQNGSQYHDRSEAVPQIEIH